MIKENFYDIIRSPQVTEKSTIGAEQNKVTFNVATDATKTQIKQAIEALFSVKVKKVNVLNRKGKTKRFRGRMGKRADTRLAIVTMAEGHNIDVTGGL